MKKQTNFLFVLLLGLVITSCNKDNPDNFTAEDYIGTFSRSDDCGNGYTDDYDVTIAYGPEDNEIILQNYGRLNPRGVTATVSGSSITFSKSASYVETDWTFDGTGTLSNDKSKLTIDYVFVEMWDDNGQSMKYTHTCTSILTRK